MSHANPMMQRRTVLAGLMFIGSIAGAHSVFAAVSSPPVVRVDRFDAALDTYIARSEPIKLLSNQLDWPEGPAWDTHRSCLFFSDVAKNRIYRWDQKGGLSLYLDPAGSQDLTANADVQRASNGLWYHPSDDTLIMCDQDSRSLQTLDLGSGVRRPLIVSYDGKKFNSPNDLAVSKADIIYFTDPTAGLKSGNKSPARQLDFAGVYSYKTGGDVTLIDKTLTFPNGIALSPDERYLYVSQSDAAAPIIRRYVVAADGSVSQGQDWFDFTPYRTAEFPGMPDGIAVANDGTLFAAGPGGVYIISPEGKALGRIFTGLPTGNCCFGEDGKTLFITADDTLFSVRILMAGDGLGA
ncbi:MAG: SMP-30/gluconolactonase/LRE family protein [Asticcacaulis sp.]